MENTLKKLDIEEVKEEVQKLFPNFVVETLGAFSTSLFDIMSKLWACDSELGEHIIRLLLSKHAEIHDKKFESFFDNIQQEIEKLIGKNIKDKEFKTVCDQLIKAGSLERLEKYTDNKIKYLYRISDNIFNELYEEFNTQLKTLLNKNN